MGTITIQRSDGWRTSIYSSLRSDFTMGVSIISTAGEASFTTGGSSSSFVISSNRHGASQRLMNAAAGFGRTGRAALAPFTQPSGSLDISEIGNQNSGSPVEVPAPVVDQPKPPPIRPEKVELTIDSLQNYELLKPIRVIVESLGDTVFVAEAPDLNVSTTGNSMGGALILLKDHISTLYESYTSKKNLDGERSRQFKVFEIYIGRPRRNWM